MPSTDDETYLKTTIGRWMELDNGGDVAPVGWTTATGLPR